MERCYSHRPVDSSALLLTLITIEETTQIFMEARRSSFVDLVASFSGLLLAWPAAALSSKADF